MRWLVVALVMVGSVAEAKPLELEAHMVGTVSVSTPKGWTFAGDQAKGMAVASQDPKRKDGAQLAVIVSQKATATEDAMLDALTGSMGMKVVKRGAGPNGIGKQLVAEATLENIKLRMGAIALVANGGAIVAFIVARADQFDAVGGTDTVLAVLASLKDTSSAPAATTTATANTEYTTPDYYANGSPKINPPTRRITLADMTGTWIVNTGAISNYVNNAYQFSWNAITIHEEWDIDAAGNIKDRAKVATGNKGAALASGSESKHTGKASFEPDGTLKIVYEGVKYPEYYIVHGWFHSKEATIIKLSGPYHEPIPAKYVNDMNYNIYMDENFVRKNQ